MVHTGAAESGSAEEAASPVITASGVTKAWGEHVVFAGLTADVPAGITGLLGANGSGKTTLLGMLLGLHEPDSGSLRVFGQDPAIAGPELRQVIGYSPEHHDLPGDMAAQDLVRHIAEVHGLPRREATTRASDALWLVGLGEERARPIATMSTGQRQRVKLAQAIAHGPRLVVLDEPTDGLDPVQRDDMLTLIHRVGTEFGIDVLLSSHLLEEVERIADNVVIIANGRASASGPIRELRSGRGGLVVVVDAAAEQVASRVQAAGLGVERQRNRLVIAPDQPAEAVVDAVRDAIADCGAPLRSLTPRQQSLEDLFLDEVYS